MAQRMRLLDANLAWFGYSVQEAMEKAGAGAAGHIHAVLKKRGLNKARIAVFCGSGNKGGDGFVAARHLAKRGHRVSVFLAAKPRTKEATENLRRLKKIKGIKVKNTEVKKRHAVGGRAFPKEKFDVFVDALLGTGLQGPLRAPYDVLVDWLNAQPGLKVAIDVPTGWGGPLYFRDDITVSMHMAKKSGAVVVDVGIPKQLEHVVGPSQVKALAFNAGKRKGQNGVLTVVGGSRKYHGAPLYAIEAAAPFVDLVYFHSPEKNNIWIAKQLKTKSRAFITLEGRSELLAAIAKSDVVLIGNGLEETATNKALVNGLLRRFANKVFVLDAGGMMLADKRLYFNRVILTPHAGEFRRCFGMDANAENARKMAKKYGCILLLKGPVDVITDGQTVMQNVTGNVGMTRGGTGDVLAGLIAALATQNDAFLSAQAGAFLNGLAGDIVARKRRAFSADDVARALPDALETALRV